MCVSGVAAVFASSTSAGATSAIRAAEVLSLVCLSPATFRLLSQHRFRMLQKGENEYFALFPIRLPRIGARPLPPIGGRGRARASPNRGLRASVGLSLPKGKQKFAERREKGRICSRATTALGQGAVCPPAGRHSARARSNPSSCAKENTLSRLSAGECILAAEEGFEPSQTESESAVLPLHNSAIYFLFRKRIYCSTADGICQVFFQKNPLNARVG